MPKDQDSDNEASLFVDSAAIPLAEPKFPEYACMCATQDCNPDQKGIGCEICIKRYDPESNLRPFEKKKEWYGACVVNVCTCPTCECLCTARWKAKDQDIFTKMDHLAPLTEEYALSLWKGKAKKKRK